MNSSLLNKLEEQSSKILRYEKRLNDIVAAYKGILRENKALQSTVKALNAPTIEGTNINQDDTDESSKINEHAEKVSQLSSSLSTLMSEKSHMENKYLTEKRIIKKEFSTKLENYDNIIMKLKNEIKKRNLKENENIEIINKQKRHIEQIQIDSLSAEENNHIMFNEVQNLLSVERNIRMQQEQRLQENKSKHCQNDQSSYISTLERDIELLNIKLKDKDKNLKSLQSLHDFHVEQMNISQNEFRESLQSEINKVECLKNEIGMNLINHEKIISSLESKINQLTMSLSIRSLLEISQQELVKNLKEKVIQLSEENCELSLRCNEDDTESNIGDNWEHSAEELQFKIIEYNIKLTEMGYADSNLHSNCINKFQLLENEFHKFKLNSDATMIKLNNEDLNFNNDLNKLKNQLKSEQDKVNIYKKEAQIVNNENIKKCMADIRIEQDQLKLQHHKDLSLLRQEVCDQRIRTLNIIEEKEQDVKVANIDKQKRDLTNTKQTFNENFNCSMNTGDFPLIHYSEEISRLENECSNLRRDKHDIHSQIREKERETKLTEVNLHSQLQQLRDIVNSSENSCKRANVNIDYVKNVTFALLSKPCDHVTYCNLVTALATALQFSSSEKQQVHKNSSKQTWW